MALSVKHAYLFGMFRNTLCTGVPFGAVHTILKLTSRAAFEPRSEPLNPLRPRAPAPLTNLPGARTRNSSLIPDSGVRAVIRMQTVAVTDP